MVIELRKYGITSLAIHLIGFPWNLQHSTGF